MTVIDGGANRGVTAIAKAVGKKGFIHALSRCRKILGLSVRLQVKKDPQKKMYSPIRIRITLPGDFPNEQRAAILETANICTVVKHVVMPSEFDVVLTN